MVVAACEGAHENEIICVGAPYEVEYQLVALEKGSICNDSDLFSLGAKLIIQQYCLGFHYSKFILSVALR